MQPRSTYIILTTLVLIVVLSKNVYAYINPGAGSNSFQAIIAFLMIGLFIIKLIFNKIKIFFVNLFSENKRKINP